MPVSPEAAINIYRRLLANEPDAPADLVELFLDPLIAALQAKFPNFPDPAVIETIVLDSLFKLIQHPLRYHPGKASLWNYLYMDVSGDLTNEWHRMRKQQQREVSFDPVAHDQPARNNDIEAFVDRQIAMEELPGGITFPELLAQLRQDIPDPKDWAALELILVRERRTERYAQVLGIADRPFDEQRRIVKQVKDRLRLRLKRRGVQIRE